jgi:AcrR family transcriptional regulator
MRARGTYKKSQASRQQVLDAAISELAKRGYAHTSVSDIATAAGMSKGAVHYHFESKDDLIGQVLERCAQVMSERARDAWETPGEPAERIRRALFEMRTLRRDAGPELRVFADLMAQGIHDARLRRPIAAMLEASRRQVVEQFVDRLKELGLQPKIPAQTFARLLLGSLDGLALHDFFDPPSTEQDNDMQRALEGIAQALLAS